MKVTTIDEVQDVSKMKVDDLTGSLLTVEMDIDDKSEKGVKVWHSKKMLTNVMTK